MIGITVRHRRQMKTTQTDNETFTTISTGRRSERESGPETRSATKPTEKNGKETNTQTKTNAQSSRPDTEQAQNATKNDQKT